MSQRQQFVETASALLDDDPAVAVVLADISVDRFKGAAARHPHRVINVGIREQLMISVAAGMALEGLRPIVHTYAPFLVERPWEQIKLDLGHQDAPAVLVSIGASYDAAPEGRTHQAPGDVALLDTLAGWTVHAPGHPDEVDRLLRAAAAAAGPSYVRLTEAGNRRAYAPAEGRLVVIRTGSRGTVVAVGPMLDRTLEATAGMDVTVLYGATIRPFDAATLVETLSSPVVALVEPYLAGTSIREVTRALAHVPHRALGIGVPPVELRRYGEAAEHDRAHGLDAPGIRRQLSAFVG